MKNHTTETTGPKGHSIKGFIEYRPAAYEGAEEYSFHPVKMSEYGYITVMPMVIDFDVPLAFDPRAQLVELLQKKRTEVLADFQKRLTEIDSQISKYTAIEGNDASWATADLHHSKNKIADKDAAALAHQIRHQGLEAL